MNDMNNCGEKFFASALIAILSLAAWKMLDIVLWIGEHVTVSINP